ncbi:ABC transporter ATP-binding protein [Sporofaciens sp. JLR.KK001]|uniref:ABC transporter ATP-binding protein n=1 Tax=Sporofaciens sp. JLR.KK001 TaxID=3112621 RepID=UPI002FF3F657
MDILQTENLTKYYGEEPLVVKALDGITLQIEQGSFTAIVGTSGSGKSTLLHMLGGLDTPTGGSVVVDGQSLGNMSRSELTIFRRRKIGFIFQNYNLIPNLNIYDNIVLPVELDGRSADRQYLSNIVSVLGLEGKLDRKPNKLSGGQQQRAAIARALITKPALILADEPTGNLDSRTSQEVVGLLQATGRQFHQTIVMITHNDEIAQIADRTIRIEDGRIAEGRWQG